MENTQKQEEGEVQHSRTEESVSQITKLLKIIEIIKSYEPSHRSFNSQPPPPPLPPSESLPKSFKFPKDIPREIFQIVSDTVTDVLESDGKV